MPELTEISRIIEEVFGNSWIGMVLFILSVFLSAISFLSSKKLKKTNSKNKIMKEQIKELAKNSGTNQEDEFRLEESENAIEDYLKGFK